MTNHTTKTAALTALIAFGTLISSSGSAAACVLHTKEGVAATTAAGVPIWAGWGCADDTGAEAPKAEGTVYFDFNKATLTPKAKHELDHLAKHLAVHDKHAPKPVITVVGYADRIGNAAYNEKLALKRAKAVHDYLLHKGVKAKKIEVRSLGESNSKTDCPADLPRKKLIPCLAEDRRVEIEVSH